MKQPRIEQDLAVWSLLAGIVMAAILIIVVPFGDGPTTVAGGYAPGPQHALGPVRDLPFTVQLLLGLLFFPAGTFAVGEGLWNISRERNIGASIAMLVIGAVCSGFGFLTVIGALVAL